MTSQTPPNNSENPFDSSSASSSQAATTTTTAATKKSPSALVWLLPALVAVGAGAAFLPGVLQKMYLAQEEAVKAKGNIVGERTDMKPPPGKSTDPYASLNQNGNAGNDSANKDDSKKSDDSSAQK